jgi:hypothetical protein
MTATRSRFVRKIAMRFGLALCIASAATSSSFAYSARAQQMCMGDAFRLCASEIPNIARITACMWRNKARVSEGCRVEMDKEADLAKKPKGSSPPVDEPTTTTKTKPIQIAPVEQKPTTASPVEKPAVTETKPIQTTPVEQKPTVASPVEKPANTETKPSQAAPIEQHAPAASHVKGTSVRATSVSDRKFADVVRRRHKHRLDGQDFNRGLRTALGFALPGGIVIFFHW